METNDNPGRGRTVRIRAYLGEVQDFGRAFQAPADANLAEFMKRCVLAVIPKVEGWRLSVISVERTNASEPVAPILDRLVCRHLGKRDFAAALAVTADGSRAVLAVGAKDAGLIEQLRVALSGKRH